MNVILIPGLWLDGSSWGEVVPVLEQAGHRAHALTLPGMESRAADRSKITLRDHIGAVVEAIDSTDPAGGPVVLVGHSGGGAIAHGAVDARPDRVARVVYVDSWPVGDGQAINDGLPAEKGEVPLPDWSLFDEEDLVDLVRADDVALRRLGEETLRALLAVAVGDAEPGEVMPPVDGPPGWTPARRDAFTAWHRARRAGLDGPLGESTYAVVAAGDEVVGSARLACRGGGRETLETGLWLGRSARGRGIGTAVLRAVLAEAARLGARTVVADTTAGNHAAITALRRCGAELTEDLAAQDTGQVVARMRAIG